VNKLVLFVSQASAPKLLVSCTTDIAEAQNGKEVNFFASGFVFKYKELCTYNS
jgi:hypothetical protein